MVTRNPLKCLNKEPQVSLAVMQDLKHVMSGEKHEVEGMSWDEKEIGTVCRFIYC